MNRILILIFGSMVCFHLQLRSQTIDLTGIIVDSASQKTLSLASVTAYDGKDSSMISFKLSDFSGRFLLNNIPLKKQLRLVIIYTGYKTYRKEMMLDTVAKKIDIGTLHLAPYFGQLEEVVVRSEVPPVRYNKDTLEFSAAAFKTLPNALLLDLLRKLPGVQIDKEGQISVNGRIVNKILVDGKAFFGDNPQMASNNLPANIIDKIQITEDKEQKLFDPTIQYSAVGQVLNIKLKRSIKKSVAGKLYGGLAPESKYETGAILNIFRDTFQVSALAFSNNINKSAFGISDIKSLGGFGRSGVNSTTAVGTGGVAINGISFGGIGSGIQTITGAGTNLNYDFSKKAKLNGQYFYGRISSDLEELDKTKQFIADTILSIDNDIKNFSVDQVQNIRFLVKSSLDSTTQLVFQPSVQIGRKTISNKQSSATYSNFKGKLNSGETDFSGLNSTNTYRHQFNFSKVFNNGKSHLILSNSLTAYGFNQNRDASSTDSIYSNNAITSIVQNQTLMIRNDADFTSYSKLYLDQAISRKVTLSFTETIQNLSSKYTLSTYGYDQPSNSYSKFDSTRSSSLTRTGVNGSTNIGVTFENKKLKINLTTGINYLNLTNSSQFTNKMTNLLLGCNLQAGNFYLGYDASVTEPSARDLQPIIDNTNLLYMSHGNPFLLPVYTHSITSYFNRYISSHLLSYYWYENFSIQENAIVQSKAVSSDGLQKTMPVNSGNAANLYSNIGVIKEYKLSQKWQTSITASTFGSYWNGNVIVNNSISNQKRYDLSLATGISFNWNDIVQLNQNYSYRNQSTFNSSADFKNIKVLSHILENEIVLRAPKNFIIESNINYLFVTQPYNSITSSNFLWNTAFSFLFLKDRKSQIKLTIHDLLNSNAIIDNSVFENYAFSKQVKSQQRFFLLTFIYNIQGFRLNKVGGKERLLPF